MSGAKNLTSDRIAAILAILQDKKQVKTTELSEALAVSVETVRRDINALIKDGQARRIFGGIALLDEHADDNTKVNAPAKKATTKSLYKLAASCVRSGMTIMIEAGAFAPEFLNEFKYKKDITIITNSLQVVNTAKRNQFNLILSGGSFDEQKEAFYGPDTESVIRHYNADIAFLGCDKLSLKAGITHENIEQSETAITMASHAEECVILATHEQFDKLAPVNTFEYADIDTLITDIAPSKEWLDAMNQEGVELLYPVQDSTSTKTVSSSANEAANVEDEVEGETEAETIEAIDETAAESDESAESTEDVPEVSEATTVIVSR